MSISSSRFETKASQFPSGDQAAEFSSAGRSGWGPGSDVAYLPGLRRDVRRYGRYQGKRKAWVMMADAGFDGQTLRDDDLVPPVRRGGNLLDPER